MGRILTTMALAVGCVLVAGCKEKKEIPIRGQPITEAFSQPEDPTDQELSEGGLKFNSPLALEILVWDRDGEGRILGSTPAAQPLIIPKCRWWVVRPFRYVEQSNATLDDLLAEAKVHTIRGYWPAMCFDDDVAKLKRWPKLQALYLQGNTTDAGLAHLKDLEELQVIRLSGSGITDASLVNLKELRGLRWLDLDYTRITDAGLSNLKDLKRLQGLRLGHTQITDAGLEILQELKELQVFNLEWTQITDAGMTHIEDLKDLRCLNLYKTGITDATLVRLKGLKGLQELNLESTKTTVAGGKDLIIALPNLKIKPDYWYARIRQGATTASSVH